MSICTVPIKTSLDNLATSPKSKYRQERVDKPLPDYPFDYLTGGELLPTQDGKGKSVVTASVQVKNINSSSDVEGIYDWTIIKDPRGKVYQVEVSRLKSLVMVYISDTEKENTIEQNKIIL